MYCSVYFFSLSFFCMLYLFVTSAQAETQGPYVHGQLRKGDEEIFACDDSSEEYLIYMAIKYNDTLSKKLPEDASEFKEIYTELKNAVSNRSCYKVEVMDHTSIETSYYSRLDSPRAVNVVKSLFHGDGPKPIILYVLTSETVPPVDANNEPVLEQEKIE